MTPPNKQLQELLEEHARLRRYLTDKNPCRGCDSLRRAIAQLWAGAWLGFCLIAIAAGGQKAGLTPEQAYARLAHRLTPAIVLLVFGVALAPLLAVTAHWNWVLWKHNQPCLPRRVQSAFMWCRARIQAKQIIRARKDNDAGTPL